MKKFLLCAVFAVILALALAACAGNGDPVDADDDTPETVETPAPVEEDVDDNGEEDEEEEAPPAIPDDVDNDALAGMNAALEMFPQYIDTGLPHVEGTIFRYALVSASPWAGLFGGAVFWDAGDDSEIATLLGTANSVFSTTPMLQWGQDGLVNWSVDVDAATLTLNLQHDVYWHDGEPLTLDDLVFAFEVMANPDYEGPRFGSNERRIVGIMEFNEGEADYIEGLVLSNNNRTLVIHLDELPPSLPYFGLWSAPMPRHIFGDMTIAEMLVADEFRVSPIGWGPFMVQHIVPGESIHFVRNENYVWGVPYIEELILERIPPEMVPSYMEAGMYDFASFPTAHFGDHRSPTNFRYLGSPTGGYTFMSFRLGTWDDDEGVNVFDDHRLMNNVYLRRAMAYAVDQGELGELLFYGLQFAAGSFMSPLHHAFMDFSVPMFPYNPQRAIEILDEAGFIDVDGDGYREMPDGSELTIVWAFIAGDPVVDEILINYHTQAWSEVGLRVELWQGRTHDRGYMWDILDFDEDNEEIHIYNWGWTAGFNPNPSGRWGHIFWNPSRYNSPEWEAILERLDSPAAWDPDYLLEAYSAMQWYLYEAVFFYPLRWSINLTALNNRVGVWDTRIGIPPAESGWHTVRLTAAEPYGS